MYRRVFQIFLLLILHSKAFDLFASSTVGLMIPCCGSSPTTEYLFFLRSMATLWLHIGIPYFGKQKVEVFRLVC